MTLKILGAILVICACAGYGVLMSTTHKREVHALRQLISALNYMECEIQYRLTPLPQLCRKTADTCSGIVSSIFVDLAGELDNQISPDAELCMESALRKNKEVPEHVYEGMMTLGRTLGRFDAEGQIRDLETVHIECIRKLEAYTNNETSRLRSYRTLALCAGIAVVIILF